MIEVELTRGVGLQGAAALAALAPSPGLSEGGPNFSFPPPCEKGSETG